MQSAHQQNSIVLEDGARIAVGGYSNVKARMYSHGNAVPLLSEVHRVLPCQRALMRGRTAGNAGQVYYCAACSRTDISSKMAFPIIIP